jgi:hypothetical protein
VITDGDKSDFIPSTEHLLKWKQERFDPERPQAAELGKIATDAAWERHPELRRLRKQFVNLDLSALAEVFRRRE